MRRRTFDPIASSVDVLLAVILPAGQLEEAQVVSKGEAGL